MYRHFFKRIIDGTLSILGVIACCIPMTFIAIAIKLDSKGPVFFRQERLGKGMKPFKIFKFRTMCDHAYEMGGLATSASDSRITKVGGLLRRTSLDELPQMFNVLNGTMAIIGPRPILDWEWDEYKDNKRFARRYDVLPGFFCTIDLVNRAALREDQFKADAAYADNLSFWLDVKTFFGVIAPVLKGSHVYRDER